MPTDFRLIYITTKDESEAKELGRRLIEAKLAACVNILPNMTSVYKWKGVIEESRESVLLAKTVETKVDALTALVAKYHSYENPCVLSFSVDNGREEYLKWLRGEMNV